MRKLLLVGLTAASLTATHAAAAQAGISLGAAVGTSWRDNKLQISDERHGLIYVRVGVPLVPIAGRAEFLAFDEPNAEYDTAIIGSAMFSLNAPLVQPYAMLGFGSYGMRSDKSNGVSVGAGVRLGAGRGLFIEGRWHEPIDRTLLSLGFSF